MADNSVTNNSEDTETIPNSPTDTGPRVTEDLFFINPVVLSTEDIEGFIRNNADGGKALAMDLVYTFQGDFADEIKADPNFLTYEGLRKGTATFLDKLPSKKGLPRGYARAMTDDEIAYLFSNAEPASLARPFLSEFSKSAPATGALVKIAQLVGPRVIPATTAAGFWVAGPPGAAVGAAVGTAATGLTSLGAAGLTYVAADWAEENVLGLTDPVITPNQRRMYEAYRTLGGGAGGLGMPYMFKEGVNLAGRRMLQNLMNEAPDALASRFVKGLDEIIGNTATTARFAPKTTLAAETAGVLGAGGGAYFAEGMDPGGTGARLASELIGGNLLAVTLLRALPSVLTKISSEDAAGNLIEGVVNTKQQKLFNRINDIYEQYGTPEQYDALLDNLTNPETTQLLEEAFPGVEFTAAQRGGDALLMAVEASSAKKGDALAAARERARRQSYDFMTSFIEGLSSTGNETNLKLAAELRLALFDETLTTNLQNRINKMLEADEQLRGKGLSGDEVLKTQEELSRNIYEIVGDYIDASSKKELELWKLVEDVPVISPLSPDTPEAELPNFLRAVEENKFINPAFQRQFQRENAAIWQFIQDSRAQLGLNRLPEFSEPEIGNLGRFERALDAAVGRLDGYPDSQKQFRDILEEGNDLLLEERGAFFRQKSQELKDDLKNIPKGTSRVPQRLVSNALNKMADLSGVENANVQRATGRAAESMDEPEPLTAKQLAEARSMILAKARGLAANPETEREALILSQIGRGIMRDLEGAEGSFGVPYDTARDYTRARHDVLTRTLVGKAENRNRLGAPLVEPEVYFEMFVRGNPSVTSVRLKQLQRFSEFADEQGLNNYLEEGIAPLSEGVFTTVTNLADSYLRGVRNIISKERFNPRTNKTEIEIDDEALQTWKTQNQELLDAFPQLSVDLDNAITARRAFEVMDATQENARKIERRQVYLSELIGGRSPTQVIGAAVEGKNPKRALQKIFRLTGMGRLAPDVQKRLAIEGSELTEEEINQGFRTAVLEYAYARSGRDAAFNPQEFYRTLFQGMPDDPKTSLMEIAMENGVFDEPTRNRIKLMTEQLMRVQAADAVGGLGDPLLEEASGPILDFYIGVLGAAAGNKAYRAVSPSGGSDPGILRASSEGAKMLRSVLVDLPAAAKLKALDLIFTDPQMVSILLRKPKPGSEGQKKQYRDVLRYIQNTFFKVGASQTPYVIRETFEEEDRQAAPYPGFPGLPEDPEETRLKNIKRLYERNREALQESRRRGENLTLPTRKPPVPAPPQQDAKLSPRSRAILEQELAQDTIGSLFS